MFSTVYSCMFNYVYQCLLMFTYVYTTASVALIPIGLADHLAAPSVSCDTKLNCCLGSGAVLGLVPPLHWEALVTYLLGTTDLLIPTFVVKLTHAGLPWLLLLLGTAVAANSHFRDIGFSGFVPPPTRGYRSCMPTQGEYGTGPHSGPTHCCGSGWAAGHGGCWIVPQTWSHCKSLSPCSDQLRGSPDIFAECPTLCLTGNKNGSPSPSWEGSPTFSRFYPLIGNFAGYTSSTSSKTPPLVLSSALPAIPGKVVGTIRAGGYIDFKEILPDNMALRRRLMEAGWGATHSQASNSQVIKDVTTWVHFFLSFVAAKVDSEETRQLMAYGQIVIMLVTKYGRLG